MILGVVWALCASWLMGILTAALLVEKRDFYRNLSLFLILGWGTGIGICSCLTFLWLTFRGSIFQSYFALEAITIIGLAVALKRRWYGGSSNTSNDYDDANRLHQQFALFSLLSFGVVLAARSLSVIDLALSTPHGNWDAWWIWNFRARFLYRGLEHWTDAFNQELAFHHPDYPLLLPSTVARVWSSLGHETVYAPLIISVAFTIASVILLYVAILHVRGHYRAFLAGLLLLWTPYFIQNGSYQYADIPLSFYFLATVLLLYLHQRNPASSRGLLTIAGVTTGLAAWTKNEGLLFALAVLIAFMTNGYLCHNRERFRSDARRFLAGLLPVLLLVFYFKARLAPGTDLWLELRVQSLQANLFSWSRFCTTCVEFAKHLYTFGSWSWKDLPFVNSLPFLFLFIAFAGFVSDRSERAALRPVVLILALMLIGYFLVYLITPKPLVWHLDTSCSRLLLQLWPSCLFIYFCGVGSWKQRTLPSPSLN
jgi:hypothetical protein